MANVKLSAIASAGAITGANTIVGVQAGTTDVQYTFTNAAAFFAAATNTLTNKTYDTAGTGNVFKINGTAVSAVTGTGSSAVLAAGPTLTGVVSIGVAGTIAPLEINRNTAVSALTDAYSGATTNIALRITSGDVTGKQQDIWFDSVAAKSILVFNRFNGTLAAPTTIVANDPLGGVLWLGYDGTVIATTPSAQLGVEATANWTASSHPTCMRFFTTPAGSTQALLNLIVQPSGGVFVGNNTAQYLVDPGAFNLGVLQNIQAGVTNTQATTYSIPIQAGTLSLAGATSGLSTLAAPAVAGTATVTLPGVTSTLAILGGNAFTAAQTITAGATLPTPAFTQTVLQIANTTSSAVALELDSFTTQPRIVQRRANTSSTSPSGLTTGNVIGSNLFQGYNGAGAAYVTAANIQAVATATAWDGSHNGAYFEILTAPDSGGAAASQLRVQGSGGLSVGNANIATDGGAGVVVATSFTGAGTGLTGTAASLTAGAVTTNANLTGPITSVGNATSVAAQTGTGTTFVMSAGPTLTGSLTLSSAALITSGNLSAAAWTTNGVRTQMAAASYTDTSSSGTVANAYTDLFGVGTILASSATTYTSYYGAFFKAPVASTNVTMTNKSALGADSISIGGQAQSTFALAVSGTSFLNGAVTTTALTANSNIVSSSVAINAKVTAQVGTAAALYAASDNSVNNSTAFISYNANASGPTLFGLKTRAASSTAPTTIVQSGDQLLSFFGQGADGADYRSGGAFNLVVDGAPTLATSMPGRWEFKTSNSGTVSPTTKFIINNAGLLVVGATQASTVPALKASSAILQARLGDDSAYAQFSASGLIAFSPTVGVGYGTGAGGTVTQATNKSTGVTLNTTTGQITMNNANLAGQTEVSFTLTNSAIAATDVVLVTIASGATANSYVVGVAATAAGSCVIQLGNVTLATTLGEAIVLNFVVIKGVTS